MSVSVFSGEMLNLQPGMLHRSAAEPDFYLVFIRIIMPYVSFCVSQGDRGFDGLPGLPGDKGHRVSQEQISLQRLHALHTALVVVVVVV